MTAGRPGGRAVRAAVRGFAAVAVLLAPLEAQTDRPAVRPSDRPNGSDLTVSLVTMGVGSRVWERFGHNAILVEDRRRGTRTAYNYGLFDFRQDDFLLRFIQGRMWYWMQGFDVDAMLRSYIRDNRSVWVQQLNLTPPERVALRDFLEWNERPENRYYRYDYYRDNCSTRVRDALDRVLGGRLRAATDTIATGTTYRFHTARLTAPDLPLYTGLAVALGEPVDREISAWEEMFLPLSLREWARRVTVLDSAGHEIPLVRSERTVFTSTQPEPRDRPPEWVPWYLVAGLALGGGLVGAGRRPRSALAWTASAWALLGGLTGAILVFLWAFTDHTVAHRNENVLQASLFLLPLAVLTPALALGRSWARRPALALAALVAAAALSGLALKLLPGFDQRNAEVLALAVPANLGLALGLRRAGKAVSSKQ
ncbi:MAG TPA: DUF4105 domain-containing protein [Gemmatimonadales bacterium]|nr:DUF4105 domain-containing protein [Gemmatimonadales bacterium]